MRNYTDKEFHELPDWAKNEIFKLEGHVVQLADLLSKHVDPEFARKQLAMMGVGK